MANGTELCTTQSLAKEKGLFFLLQCKGMMVMVVVRNTEWLGNLASLEQFRISNKPPDMTLQPSFRKWHGLLALTFGTRILSPALAIYIHLMKAHMVQTLTFVLVFGWSVGGFTYLCVELWRLSSKTSEGEHVGTTALE